MAVYGIFQGDVMIKSALIYALDDMRKNPWVLDFVFNGLGTDEDTSAEYGQKEIDKAKAWFVNTAIAVTQANLAEPPSLPCISIALADSSEDVSERTTADTHYDTSQTIDTGWPAVLGPASPSGYSYTTGVMTFNPVTLYKKFGTTPSVLLPFSDQTPLVVVTSSGKVYDLKVLSVQDARFSVAPGTVENFTGCSIKYKQPTTKVALESSSFRETYVIGCHTRNEQYETLYLHSIVTFALLRYKQRFFEARGFERSTFSSSDLALNPEFDTQLAFSRFITLSGHVRQYWPKDIEETIQTTTVLQKTEGVPNSTEVSLDEVDFLGEQDALGG